MRSTSTASPLTFRRSKDAADPKLSRLSPCRGCRRARARCRLATEATARQANRNTTRPRSSTKSAATSRSWRALPNPADWGVTPTTARLLAYWRSHQFSGVRPFFCQIEAVETIIWLTEVAQRGPQYRSIREHLKNGNAASNTELFRLAMKMATGAGKTTVMAMLIAWHTANAVRTAGSDRFSKLVPPAGSVIALRVLGPQDAQAVADGDAGGNDQKPLSRVGDEVQSGRAGRPNQFLAGRTKVTDRHAAADYAQVLKELSDVHFPDAEQIRLVQDNLSTHTPASLYAAFPAPEVMIPPAPGPSPHLSNQAAINSPLHAPATAPAPARKTPSPWWQCCAGTHARCVPKGERLILSRLKVAKMTHAQIAEAQRMAGEWKPK